MIILILWYLVKKNIETLLIKQKLRNGLRSIGQIIQYARPMLIRMVRGFIYIERLYLIRTINGMDGSDINIKIITKHFYSKKSRSRSL